MYIRPVFETNAPDFEKLAKKEKHPQKRVRLIALAQLKTGAKMREVAKSLGVERHAIGEWYARYKNFGLEGLDNLPKMATTSKIPKEREEEFIRRIESLQNSKNGGRVTGYDIQAMAREEFGANYADSSIYMVLKRLKISWVTARSKHPKVNEDDQVSFKKTSFKRSAKVSPKG